MKIEGNKLEVISFKFFVVLNDTRGLENRFKHNLPCHYTNIHICYILQHFQK